MSRFDWCSNCGELCYDNHKCDPEWQAVLNEDEDFLYKAFGHDGESAVLNLAERRFPEWDYPEEMEIWVKKETDTEWQKFDVMVELSPSFSATPKKD